MNKLQKDIKSLTNIIKEKYKPEKIILFGSAAWGGFSEGSDIDFFIVKNSRKRRDNRTVDVFRIIDSIEREFAMDVLVYTPKEVQKRLDLGDFFVKRIFKHGKVLYES